MQLFKTAEAVITIFTVLAHDLSRGLADKKYFRTVLTVFLGYSPTVIGYREICLTR